MIESLMQWIARRFKYTRHIEFVKELYVERNLELIGKIHRLRQHLPEGRYNSTQILDALDNPVQDISTLMAACIDYRNLLIRADVPDSVSGRHEGVEAIMKKYGIELVKRKAPIGETWGIKNREVND